MARVGRLARRAIDSAFDAWVRAAPAQHLEHRAVHLRSRRLRMFAQQGLSHHDLARLAPPALGHLFVDPCLLDGGELPVAGETFYRGDLLAHDVADRRDTRVRRFPIHIHEAHRAFADAAAELRASKFQVIP